jgi:hypothetical protein
MMPKARNRFERSVQVLRWVDSEWDFPLPVSLRWEEKIPGDEEAPHGLHGYVEEDGGRLYVYLCAASNPSRSIAVDSLLHELAHCLLWAEGLGLRHGPRFWQQFGELMDAFDHHGFEDSASFPVD